MLDKSLFFRLSALILAIMVATVLAAFSAMDYAVRDQFTEITEETQIAQQASDGALGQLARRLAVDDRPLREIAQSYAVARPDDLEFLLVGPQLQSIYASNDLFREASVEWVGDGQLEIEASSAPGNRTAISLVTNNYEEIERGDGTIDGYLIGLPPPPSQVDAESFAMRAWTEIAAWLGLIVIVGMALSALVIRWMIRPIDRLTRAALELNEGRVPERLEPPRLRELEGLFDAFNSATSTIRRTADLRKQMVADVAHELRTPITNLRSQVEAFDAGLVNDKEALGETLKSELGLLERLISDFQQLSLSDSGQLPVRMMDLDLADLAVATIGPNADTADYVLQHDLDAPIPIKADPDRVQQVLLNLVENATRHRAEGLVIRLEAIDSGKHAGVRFSDNGPGISEGAGEKIFERFYRGEISRKQDAAGAGLGLTIARSLMLAMGGSIKISDRSSDKANGAAFDLLFLRGSPTDE